MNEVNVIAKNTMSVEFMHVGRSGWKDIGKKSTRVEYVLDRYGNYENYYCIQ